MLRRFLSIGAVTVAGAALLVGSTVGARAQVEAGFSDVLAFAGSAQITSDNDSDSGTAPAVDLVGGAGTFNFTTTACEGVSDTEAGGPVELPGGCTLTVTGGSYDNVVCGTGWAGGLANLSGFESGPITFSIYFAGTVGIVTGSATTSGPAPEGTDSPDQIVGPVLITASPNATVPPDTGDCTNAFTVAGGAIALDLLGTTVTAPPPPVQVPPIVG